MAGKAKGGTERSAMLASTWATLLTFVVASVGMLIGRVPTVKQIMISLYLLLVCNAFPRSERLISMLGRTRLNARTGMPPCGKSALTDARLQPFNHKA